VMSEVQTIADRVAMIRQGEIVEVADTRSLIDRAMREVTVTFKEAVSPEALAKVPGVTLLSRNDGGMRVILQVKGDMEALIGALDGMPVRELETSKPSLEEVFLRYYEEPG